MTDEQLHQGKNKMSMSSLVTLFKDIFSLFRDAALFVLAVLLLVFPTTLNQILTDAGFEEGSIVGFKWKRGLVESNEKLRVAEETIATLRSQNDSLSKALSEANASTGDIQEKFDSLQSENKRIAEAAKQVQVSVAETLESNAPLVEKAATSTGRTGYPGKAFCYQEDRHKDGASRFSVHCHETKEKCETARGPSTVRIQTECVHTDLSAANWRPGRGWMGSWFQFSRTPFGEPFPQLR